jgi:6-pyruvoyltetrahydropterin/6-carboxytetrahydropterin synthase
MPGVYELYIDTHFSAAHALKGYDGDCARLHGHNWSVRVFVRCSQLDTVGMGMDFRLIKGHVREVLAELDHANISDLPCFDGENPTSENIARYLYRTLGARIDTDTVRVSRIQVSETSHAGVYYWED